MAKQNNTETSFTDVRQAGGGRGRDRTDARQKLDYDPGHKGPNLNRSCTDIICCLIFIAFIAGLVVVAYFAYFYGDPKLLIYPQDSNGNLCGFGKYRNKEKLFFFDLVKCGRMGPGVFVNGCPTPQVCVESCPGENFVYLQALANNDRSKLICQDGVDVNNKSVQDLIEDEDCAAYYLKSTAVINRCLPIDELLDLGKAFIEVEVNSTRGTTKYNLTEAGNQHVAGKEMSIGLVVYQQFLNAKEYGEKIVADVVASWWMILIGLVVAMAISMIWIVLMRWIVCFMVWFTILAFVLMWAFLTGICWYLYSEAKGKNESLTVYLVWRFTFEKESVFLAGGIIFGVILAIFLLILLFLCERIRIAIALIEHGSRAVSSMWSSLFWPILPFLLQIGVVALWISIATFLASIGREPAPEDNNVTFSNGSINEQAVRRRSEGLFEKVPCNTDNTTLGDLCGFIKYGQGDYTIYLQIYNLFMLFWLINFVAALDQLTLAGAFSSFYWSSNNPKNMPTFPVLAALWRCFRYHLGSLAFGSLLIALVQLVRVFLEYVDSKLKGAENQAAKFLIKCLKCCFWCLEKVLKFFTKNAFIMMAVYGGNFCASAKRAFGLIMTNIVRVFVLDKVMDFVFIVCKLTVVGAVAVIAYFFFDGRIEFLNEYQPKLNFYIVPIIVVILGAYIIADIFFSVYEMAVDTIFLCFLDDLDRNEGTAEKPYFMDKDLMKILGKKNEQPKSSN